MPACLYLPWGGIGIYYAVEAPHEIGEHAHMPIQVSLPLPCSTVRGRFAARPAAPEVPGRVAIFPSQQPHPVQWHRHADVVSFYLDPLFVEQVARESLLPRGVEIVGCVVPHDPLIQQLCLALLTQFRVIGSASRFYLESLATVLAVHLMRHYAAVPAAVTRLPGGLPRHRLRRALEFLDAHIEHEVRLAEVAATVGLSPYHFGRLFKRATGLTPHEYLMERRIERAKALLVDRGQPIAAIALRLGFSSQAHFTAFFRRLTGTTPGAYRSLA